MYWAGVVRAVPFSVTVRPLRRGSKVSVMTTPAQYTYDAATGLFSTVAGVVTVPAATITQDAATGAYTVVPGTATLTVTGTV